MLPNAVMKTNSLGYVRDQDPFKPLQVPKKTNSNKLKLTQDTTQVLSYSISISLFTEHLD